MLFWITFSFIVIILVVGLLKKKNYAKILAFSKMNFFFFFYIIKFFSLSDSSIESRTEIPQRGLQSPDFLHPFTNDIFEVSFIEWQFFHWKIADSLYKEMVLLFHFFILKYT